MPTYQYRCQTCAHEFEARQSFADDALTDCPASDCGGSVNKVFSGVGIAFKGDGFYRNDHGASKKTTTPKKTSSGSTSTPESSTTKTESTKKPAETKTNTTSSSD